MGDGRAGLLDGGDGPAGWGQVAQVEGHGLRGGGQRGVATGLGPRSEPLPGGGIGPAGVPGLGVPESCSNGLGRTAVALGQIQGVAELLDDGEIGGHGRPVKFVIIPYYHDFNSALKMPITRLLARLAGDVGLRGFG